MRYTPWMTVLLVNHIQEAPYLPSSNTANDRHSPPKNKQFRNRGVIP